MSISVHSSPQQSTANGSQLGSQREPDVCAAAATAIIVSLESAPQPATFTADRHFLFWIEHSSTGEMLFLGQVTNPA